MKPKSKILIIAGPDSSGGAGIQADIKTVTALGGYAMTAQLSASFARHLFRAIDNIEKHKKTEIIRTHRTQT